MGKNNYIIAQRQGLSIFWKNSWSSDLNYIKLFNYFFISEKFIENILLNFLRYNLINKKFNINFKKKFNLKLFKTKNFSNILYIGKIWFLKFSNWIIVNINLLLKNKLTKNKKKKINFILMLNLTKKKFNKNFIF
jgi:hypothetical protein